MKRREFLVGTGAAIGAAAAAPAAARPPAPPRPGADFDPGDWESVRAQFDLDPAKLHFSGFFLASHPRQVRDAIERHRKGLDADPFAYENDNNATLVQAVAAAAAEYLGVQPHQIALTDSTTMGLGLLYSGLRVREGQEILATTHDHYSTRCSLEFRAQRTGASVRTIPLYDESESASADEIVGRLSKAITPKTRVVAATWVHSSTGVKLPLRAMADAIAAANRGRDEQDRALFCVDGVHGLGIENVSLPDLGCDFFVAGTHKWVFGPRGTGIWWGRDDAWPHVTPAVPPFGPHDRPGSLHTPGGFHSFEHRWALTDAFRFHLAIGKQPIHDRIHALNRRIREGLTAMPHIALATPRTDDLSAGINCFDVSHMRPMEAVRRLWARGVVASESPYARSYVRLAGSLLVNEAQVEQALGAVRELA